MKQIILTAIALFCTLHFISAQTNTKIIGNYYYLDYPRSDIFNSAFSIPDGKSDPQSIPSNSDQILETDLVVSTGASKQTKTSITNRNNKFLLSTWSRVKGISVSTDFSNVKHTQVKNASWAKYKDQGYHVIEALSADTTTIKIFKNKNDTIGSAFLQSVAKLFVAPKTVVGQILTLLGGSDSASKTQQDLVKLKSATADTVTLSLTDAKVYFAVRYAKINDAKNLMSWSLFGGSKVAHPVCAPKVDGKQPKTLKFKLGPGQSTFNLMGTNCVVDNYTVIANFVNDFPDGGTVYITKKYRGGDAQNSQIQNEKTDTIYISETINFSDEYFDRYYNDSRPFIANQVAQQNGSQNKIVVCDFEFLFNPKTREIKIKHYNKYFHTCIYEMTANISFFPN